MMVFVTSNIALSYYTSSDLNEFAYNFMMYFVVLGVACMWTVTEYVMHRFSRHGENFLDPEGPADPDYLESIFKGHLSHHVFMN
jgi:hypothetical protein